MAKTGGVGWRDAQVTILMPDKPFLELKEVAILVGADESTIRRWIKDGQFPESRPVGSGRRAWSAAAVAAWHHWQAFRPLPEDSGSDGSEAT